MADKKIFTVRTDIIPDLQLSEFGIADYEQAEAEFSRKHMAIIMSACESASDRIAEITLRIAHSDVAHQRFAYDGFGFGGHAFKVCAFSDTNLPYLLWLTMLKRHPKMIVSQARDMVEAMTPEDRERVQKGVLELVGYSFEKKEPAPPSNPPNQSPSTSPPSSPDSANAASDTKKSAA